MNLRFLTGDDCRKIHESALKLLEETGIAYLNETARDLLKNHGARVSGKRVFFPRQLVEKSLATCPDSFLLEARNPDHSVTIGGDGLVVNPNGGEVFISDLDGGRRPGTLKDVANIQKITQHYDVLKLAGFEPINPSDVDVAEKDLWSAYEFIKNTDKPILAPLGEEDPQKLDTLIGMLELPFGRKGYFRDHYCTWGVSTPVSPLTYVETSCQNILTYAKWNQPMVIIPAAMSGITAPISLSGTLIQYAAELLGGVVLCQATRPGLPVIVSGSTVFGNMQLATWECGSPESALLFAACCQMVKDFYKLPARSQCGISSSKAIDYQAGYETMQGLLTATLVGTNVMSNTLGSLENLMVTSYEKFILDVEMLSRMYRFRDGINTSDMDEYLGVIQEVVQNKSEFLFHKTTLEHCRNAWQPDLADWNSYDKWSGLEEQDIIRKANLKYKEIIDTAPDSLIDKALDKELQAYISAATGR